MAFQSRLNLLAMLSSAASALRYTKSTRNASWGLKSTQTSKKIVAKALPSTTASSSRRSYAIMKHTDPYVAADYASYVFTFNRDLNGHFPLSPFGRLILTLNPFLAKFYAKIL